MKKAKCNKCKKTAWIEKHHILPICDFSEKGEVFDLCSNCHTDYHQKIGNKNLKGQSLEFHYEKFFRWIAGLSILIVVFVLSFV